VVLALSEVESLLAAGRVEEANQRARRCAAEAAGLEVARAVGAPVQVSTLPAGADLKAGERPLGAAPAVLWVKEGAPLRVRASAPGFLPCDRDIACGSAPDIQIELARASRFRVDLGTPVDVHPLASGGVLFIGARDGVLYRLDLQSGARLDAHATGSLSGIAAPPLAHAGLVLLALGEGEVRAVERDTLAVRWCRPHGATLAGPPVLAGGRLLVATVDGRIFDMDAATGEERLVAGVAGPLRFAPAILGKTVAAGATNGSVIAVCQDDGRPLFATPERAHPIIGLAAAAGLIVAADDGGTLLGLDPGSGGVLWERETGQAAAAPPAACGELIVFAAGRTAFVLDARSGAVRLAAEVGAWIAGTPALAGGRLYVGDHAGTLSVFDLADGALLYRHQMGSRIRATPLVLQEGVLLISERGAVALLDA
ncbi:MAG: PQQ-binding-like beta-propeller repeat protein, partial [Planctomycetes bacterium]|nr:PQQ-binding-like beta-propeller repeat protein [Planctomycetota bacterium]